MKKVLFFLLCFATIQAQQLTTSQNVYNVESGSLTLTGTASATLYFTFPPPDGTESFRRIAISSTLPTFSIAYGDLKTFETWGDAGVTVVLDSTVKQESDSFYSYIRPLFPDYSKSTWYVSTNDTTFLNFGSVAPQAQSTIGYLDWSHGYPYTATLCNELWPFKGFTWTVGQVSNDVATSATIVYWTITH